MKVQKRLSVTKEEYDALKKFNDMVDDLIGIVSCGCDFDYLIENVLCTKDVDRFISDVYDFCNNLLSNLVIEDNKE